MSMQIFNALGMKELFDLIEVSSEWLSELKKRELKRPGLKFSEAKDRYARLERLLGDLHGHDNARRTLGELLAHIPKLSLPRKQDTAVFALHELFLFKEFLYHYGNLAEYIRKQGWMDHFLLPGLEHIFILLDPDNSGLPAFRLSGAYSEKLAGALSQRIELAQRLKHARAQVLEEARSELGLPELKEEFVLSRTQTALAERVLHSPFFILSYENVANYGFLLADDDACLEIKKQLSLLGEKQEKEEARVLRDISKQINTQLPLLHSALAALEQGTWLWLLGDFALRYACRVPQLTRKKSIRVKGAVNLPLKLHLESLGRCYYAVDYDFDQKVSLLTGPNMGGKTTILKTLGQLCWLARLGIPLPCEEAELPLFDGIWYNQDETQSSADLSSFGREVVSFTQALQEEGCTLFLLDEFARGTNPAEGELLVSAVLKHLSSTGHVCVAATHFTAPALLDGLAHYSIAGLDTEAPALKARLPLSPSQRLKALSEAMDYSLRRLKKNQAPPLSAIRVARILGLPEAILKHTESKGQ
jgi:DNA mismatch repair ATPase MutS